MSDLNGPKMGDLHEANRKVPEQEATKLKPINETGLERIETVSFDFCGRDEHDELSEVLVSDCATGSCHLPHQHKSDLLDALLDAIENLSNIDTNYLESLEESSDDWLSRTISYIYIPLALSDCLRALRNLDSNRRLHRAAKAYQNYVLAVSRDLDQKIDERFLLKAFETQNQALAHDHSADALEQALYSEIRKAKASSGLDLTEFVSELLCGTNLGQVMRSRIFEGLAERTIKTQMTKRIGAFKARSRINATQSFQTLKSSSRLDLFTQLSEFSLNLLGAQIATEEPEPQLQENPVYRLSYGK